METLTVLKFNTAKVQKTHLTWLWMKRVSKAVLIGAVLPLTPRTPTNPEGILSRCSTICIPLSKLVKGATLKIYKGAPQGMCTTLKNRINEDLLSFFKE
jgi:hypothetical protein